MQSDKDPVESVIPQFNKTLFSYAPFRDPYICRQFRLMTTLHFLLPTICAIVLLILINAFDVLEEFFEEYMLVGLCSGFIFLTIVYGQAVSIILARKVPLNYLLFISGCIFYAIAIGCIASNFSKTSMFIFVWGQLGVGLAIFGYSVIVKEKFNIICSGLSIFINLMLVALILMLAYPKAKTSILLFCLLNNVLGFLNSFNLNNMIENFDYVLMPEDFIMGSSRMTLEFYIYMFKKNKKQSKKLEEKDDQDDQEETVEAKDDQKNTLEEIKEVNINEA